MGVYFNRLFSENTFVQAIHTAVKGRARYKVSGLHRSEALKTYLECRLSKEERITRVNANPLTGNILVMFQPNLNDDAIALLIQDIVIDYRETRNLPLKTANFNIAPEKAKNFLINQSLPLAPLAVAIGLSIATVRLAAFDAEILLAIQKLHAPVLDRIMLGTTFLGDPVILLLTCLGLGSGLIYNNRRGEATTLGITAVGSIGLNCWLKVLFGRMRPALWDRLVDVGLHSFPSGHAMVSIAVYGFLGYILAKQFPQRRGRIVALTAVLIIAIGFSRLYLGVHWPTDVAAGYAIGLAWLLACIVSLELSELRSQAANSLPEYT